MSIAAGSHLWGLRIAGPAAAHALREKANRLRTNREFYQIRRAATDGIGLNVEFFNGEIQSVRPVSLVAETFCPGGIPAGKGGEEDLFQ